MLTSAAYPLIMLVAVICGGMILRTAQRALPMPTDQRIAIGLAAFCGAMLGAKLPFVLSDWSGLLSGTAWFSNGKTILCGLVGAYGAVELTKWTLNIRTKTGDSFVVGAAVAVAIGRLGCLVAGCCYGMPTNLPWAMRCAQIDDIPRHPTQLYEALLHASLALLMFHFQRRGIWKGQLAKFYILSYCTYRIGSEFLRPEKQFAFGLTGYQWFAIACLPAFAYLWWRDASVMQAQVAAPLPFSATVSPPTLGNAPIE